MARYRFSTESTLPALSDFDVELADDDAAILEAALTEVDLTRNGRRCRVSVWDSSGRLLNR